MYDEQSTRMIRWPEGKTPDTWHDVTQLLNWDFAEAVLDWVVMQPECDKATAAYLFWLSDPDWFATTLGRDDKFALDARRLFDMILDRWKAGAFTRAELSWDDWIGTSAASHLAMVAEQDERRDPLGIPQDLFQPVKGHDPDVPRELRTEANAELRDLLRDLGTICEPSP